MTGPKSDSSCRNYRLDFILFSFEVDLTAQAVSRLEP